MYCHYLSILVLQQQANMHVCSTFLMLFVVFKIFPSLKHFTWNYILHGIIVITYNKFTYLPFHFNVVLLPQLFRHCSRVDSWIIPNIEHCQWLVKVILSLKHARSSCRMNSYGGQGYWFGGPWER
jgi:hypothetical protein